MPIRLGVPCLSAYFSRCLGSITLSDDVFQPAARFPAWIPWHATFSVSRYCFILFYFFNNCSVTEYALYLFLSSFLSSVGFSWSRFLNIHARRVKKKRNYHTPYLSRRRSRLSGDVFPRHTSDLWSIRYYSCTTRVRVRAHAQVFHCKLVAHANTYTHTRL